MIRDLHFTPAVAFGGLRHVPLVGLSRWMPPPMS